ncbi:hypothetical protein [Streptomyces sp. NPDC020917]|uniref:hypothetical protein n=1 Tax=Streptomyces sp. NPDC020917 TaxID=3365102 RepID=UPI0037A4B1C3
MNVGIKVARTGTISVATMAQSSALRPGNRLQTSASTHSRGAAYAVLARMFTAGSTTG